MDYQSIRTDRQFKDTTGHSHLSFQKLLLDYEATYISEYGQRYEDYIEENVTEPPKFKTLGEALFFVLFQLKNDLIWGSLGAVFQMAGSTAHTNFERFLKLLHLTLEKKSNAKTKF